MLRYLFLTARARPASTLFQIVLLAFTVAAITAISGVSAGLRRATSAAGRPEIAVVLRAKIRRELDSRLAPALVEQIGALPEVAREGEQPLVSGEYWMHQAVHRADGSTTQVMLRGLDPIGRRVHDEISLREGRWPEPGEAGVVIGQRQYRRLRGLAIGQKLRVGRRLWPVLGVFSAARPSPFESEIWGDRAALMQDADSKALVVIQARLADAHGLPAFATAVAALTTPPLEAVSEQVYRERLLGDAAAFMTSARTFMLLMMLATMFACVNASYAAFLLRSAELATLSVLGYGRLHLVGLLVGESVLLGALGSLLGVALAALARGYEMPLAAGSMLRIVFPLVIDAHAIVAGVVVGLGVALTGAIFAVIGVVRMNALVAIRER